MTRRMTDVLIATVFSITLLGLAHTAKSGLTAETASKKSKSELLGIIDQMRTDVRELRQDVGQLHAQLQSSVETKAPNTSTKAIEIDTKLTSPQSQIVHLDLDPPTTAEVLKALINDAQCVWAALSDSDRKNVKIVLESIVSKDGVCRHYPLVGPASLKTCHLKYRVSFDRAAPTDPKIPLDHVERLEAIVSVSRNYLVCCPDSNGIQ